MPGMKCSDMPQVVAPLRMCQLVVPHMIKRRSGLIINHGVCPGGRRVGDKLMRQLVQPMETYRYLGVASMVLQRWHFIGSPIIWPWN